MPARPRSHLRRLLAVSLSAALLPASAASASPVAVAAPKAAAVCTSGVPGDVNGDGYAEVAVGAELEKNRLSGVHVFYGKPSGLVADRSGTALDDQYIGSTTTLPGGYTIVRTWSHAPFGDFNGDGCADLVLSVADDQEYETDQLSTVVVYGSERGLQTATAQRISSVPVPAGFTFNYLEGPFAVGDLDHDGTDDLVGVSSYGVDPNLDDGDRQSGYTVLYGDAAGLNRGSTPVEVVRVVSRFDGTRRLPASVAVGDFDDDGTDELAMDIDEQFVETVERGSAGFAGQPRHRFSWADLGLFITDGVAEPGQLAAADVTGDGRDDLAVGTEHFACGSCPAPVEPGAVALLLGSAGGLTLTGHQLWTQASPGVAGGSDPSFGRAVVAARLDDDRYADVAIGADSTVNGQTRAGTVTVLRGSPDGLTTSGIGGSRFSQASTGVGGSPKKADGFGATLTTAYVQGRGEANLIVGVPNERRDGKPSVGQFTQLTARSAGPTGKSSVTLHLDRRGVKGVAVRYSTFGSLLSGRTYEP